MRSVTLLCVAALAVACAPAEEQPPAEEMAEAPTVSLGDVAGTWAMRSMMESSDSVITEYTLTATDSTQGWSITFPGRDPMPLQVMMVEGDSVVTELGPYESLLREGVMVSVRSVSRLEGDTLVGTFVAHYATDAADSVLRGRQRGMRAVME